MRWQRVARLLLAVVGVGFAIAVYVLTRERPPVDPQPPTPPPEEIDAKQAGGPGREIFLDLQTAKKRGELTFSRSAVFPDGRLRYENAKYADERGYSFSADVLVARGATSSNSMPAEIELQGPVTFGDTGGLSVETVNATYRDREGVLTMPGEVTFTRGRVSGRGRGAIYERDTDTVQLLAEAVARIAADATGQGAAEATAARMTLQRGQKALLLDGQARIVGETETLAGDIANVYFTDDESAVRFLELRGHASVVPVNASAGGAPDMRGDNITITFHPDGRTLQHATLTGAASLQLAGGRGLRSIRGSWIDLFTAADGKTVTRLEAKDDVVVVLPASGETPAREIRAATLLATGSEAKGLETARFQTGVRFVEQRQGGGAATSERTVTSTALVLALGGDLEAIERAEFQRDVVFLDGGTRGEADLVVYEAAKERVHLTPGTRKPPRDSRVTDEDVTVTAVSIDLDMKTHDLQARGNVTTVSSKKGDRRSGGFFDGDEPIIGTNADELEYRRDSRTGTYTSRGGKRAVVRQGKNVIEAPSVTFSDQTGNLDASDNVVTTFVMSARDQQAPVEYRTTARTFQYDDAKRVAVYRSEEGQPPIEMTGSDKSTTVGRTMTLHLAAESRTLDTLAVEREVWTKMPDGTEASGDRLDVDESTGIYVLTGKAARPARVRSAPDGKSTMCTLTVGETIQFNRRTKSVTQPPGQAFGTTQQVPCTQSIR